MEETLEQLQARHRKEKKELQGRITNKKKNATKKNRKSVKDECAEEERRLESNHKEELAKLTGDASPENDETSDQDEPQDTRPDNDGSGLASKLNSTTLSEPAASSPVHPASTGGGEGGAGGGKKRNRQKERLARRAAEQEAAAEAAEAEASNMVDHRDIEKTDMLKQFTANGLEEREIAPDGHCLFAAVADQLAALGIPIDPTPSDAPKVLPYRIVRRKAAGYIESHADDFAGFLEEPLGEHVAKIRDTAEWGGQPELNALANTYGVEIKVIQNGRIEPIRPNGADEGAPLKTIWLAYYRHGYGLGEHYNSLRKAS